MILNPAIPKALARHAEAAKAAAATVRRQLEVRISCDEAEAFHSLMATTACERVGDRYIISDHGAQDLLDFARDNWPLYNSDGGFRHGGETVTGKAHIVLCGSDDAKTALEQFARLIGSHNAHGAIHIPSDAARKMARMRD